MPGLRASQIDDTRAAEPDSLKPLSGKQLRQPPWPLLVALSGYTIAVVWLYPLYQYRINPDGISYFSLAEKYLQHDWAHATAGHWSPLFIWFLALGMKAGASPIGALTLTQGLGSALLLWATDRLGRTANLPSLPRLFLLLTVALLALAFSFAAVTPDVLVIALLTAYVALSADGKHLAHDSRAVAVGAVAALAFLARAYAFYFIVVHVLFCAFAALWIKTAAARPPIAKILRNTATIFVAMLVVASPWIACLSWKYGRFTLTSAGDSHFRQMAPAFRKSGIERVGLQPPPNATAPNYWEDPDQLKLAPWSPFDSSANRRYYLSWIGEQCAAVLLWALRLSLTALPLFCFALVRWARGRRDPFASTLLSASLIFPAGYCLTAVLDRYVIPVAIWILVLSVWIAFDWALPKGRRAVVLCGLLCISYVPYPIFSLLAQRHQGELEHRIGLSLQPRLEHGARVASLSEFHKSMYVCYNAQVKYYGLALPASPLSFRQELAKFDIQYLLVWNGEQLPADLLGSLRSVDDGSIPPEVKVYALRSHFDNPPKEIRSN